MMHSISPTQPSIQTRPFAGDAAAANAFYDAFGFTEAYKSYAWKKVW